jgi:cephalosporin-C deacetylase-like acetyl esterase
MQSYLLASLLFGVPIEPGSFHYGPLADQSALPARYQLEARDFTFQSTLKYDLPLSGVAIHRVTFPSPVKSPHKENNTVHAEYYQSTAPGKHPATVILDITGGDQSLSRGIALYLAQNKINALFVQMAYYGPRRPPGTRLRFLSTDIPRTMAAVRQTVLDVRVAGAWLASRPENDADRIGILGTSLGSFVAALCAETDTRFSRVVLLLGGGGLVDAFYDHPQAKPYVRIYELLGGNKDRVKKLLAPVDPLTLAGNLRGRSVIMFNASRDEIVPPSATNALWEAAGRPRIIWYDTTHYGAALYIPKMFRVVVDYLNSP